MSTRFHQQCEDTQPVQLPDWFDCEAAVDRGDATALQRFIYEYDYAIPELSKEFLAGLRDVLDEARSDPDTIAALLKERDALRDAADMALNVLIGCVVAGDGADDQRSMLEAQSMLRAALADERVMDLTKDFGELVI